MFPTLSHITEYLFNIKFPIHIYTFGLVMAMSFIAAYMVFVAEFKRKEHEGIIHAFDRKVIEGAGPTLFETLFNAIIGFILGYKAGYILLNFKAFADKPTDAIFSLDGNLIAGIMLALAFGWWIYYERKKEKLSVPKVVIQRVHPYQLMPLIVFSVGFWGFIGAKLFDCLENWDSFINNPVTHILSYNGFTYYGGLIFGALSYLVIGYRRGMKLVHLLDIGSPGMMLAYGVGRIGCHLSGDGDWGIVNNNIKPGWLSWLPNWMWSYKFPHNIAEMGEYITGCRGDYCYQLRHGVYPTSFYEAVLCIGLFLFLWMIRRKLHAAGLMFSTYLILNGAERFLMESIRVNTKYSFTWIALTQAELIALLMIAGGSIGLISIYFNKKAKLQV